MRKADYQLLIVILIIFPILINWVVVPIFSNKESNKVNYYFQQNGFTSSISKKELIHIINNKPKGDWLVTINQMKIGKIKLIEVFDYQLTDQQIMDKFKDNTDMASLGTLEFPEIVEVDLKEHSLDFYIQPLKDLVFSQMHYFSFKYISDKEIVREEINKQYPKLHINDFGIRGLSIWRTH